MASLFGSFALDAGAARLSDLLRRLGQFWLGEFLALFPARRAQWLVGRGSAGLVLEAQADTIVLRLLDDGGGELACDRLARADYAPASIDRFLQAHKLARSDVALGVRLPRSQVFGRILTLPREAMRSLDRIVAQDLIAKTPFRREDIYCGHVVTRSGADKIAVRQWVARRDVVEAEAAALAVDLAAMGFVDTDADPEEAAPHPRIALRPERADRSRWVARAATALAASALVLALLAAGLTYWRQAAALDELDGQVTAARAKAQQVRTAIDKLERKQAMLLRLRARKAEEPGLLDAWEEATRILPSHSWLTELRLSETDKHQQVSMTGFSAEAASLVGIIDQSPFFADASLTAPIALEPVEQRERFALQAKLKRPEPIRRASR
jgi:general secretion pathway protein L